MPTMISGKMPAVPVMQPLPPIIRVGSSISSRPVSMCASEPARRITSLKCMKSTMLPPESFMPTTLALRHRWSMVS